MAKIAVLGAGTWAMALARMLANTGNEVKVWSAVEKEIDDLMNNHMHKNLPGMEVPSSIFFTKDMEEVFVDAEILLVAVASAYVRSTMERAVSYVNEGITIISVAKGIEADTLFTMTDIIEDVLTKAGKLKGVDVVALSGPTHAEEVAFDLPTTIVAASKNVEATIKVQNIFMNSCMRVYTNTDVNGVELCGALKNIIALACGISTGLGYGDNARAALITRGLAEITRLGTAMGSDMSTFMGLAGIGDLIVTATSQHSRNNRCGQLMGKGLSAKQAMEDVGMVVEGIFALPAAIELSKKYDVELPIISLVNDLVNGKTTAKETTELLMQREKKSEFDSYS